MSTLPQLKKASSYDQEKILRAMDPADASALIWGGFRDGVWGEFREYSGQMRTEMQLLIQYPQSATLEDLTAYAEEALRDPSHSIRAWSERAEQAYTLGLDRDRKAMVELGGKLQGEAAVLFAATRALTGESDQWTDAVLDRVAVAYMETEPIWDGHWLRLHGDKIPEKPLAAAVVRKLGQAGFVSWALVDLILPHLDEAQTVELFVTHRGKAARTRAVAALSKIAKADALLDAIGKAAAAAKDGDRTRRVAYLRMQLHVAAKTPVPEALDAELGYFSSSPEDLEIDKRLFTALPAKRAAAIASKSIWGNRHLLSVIDDDGLLAKAVAELEKQSNLQVADAVGDVGARVLPHMEAALQGKTSAKLAAPIAHALGRIADPASAELLVALLGHSSKVVREAALVSLDKLDAVAKPALEAGAKAKKKSIRVGCEAALARFEAADAAGDSPLTTLAAAYEKLDAKDKKKITTLPDNDHSYGQHAATLAEEYGTLVLVPIAAWFVETYKASSWKATSRLFGAADVFTGYRGGKGGTDAQKRETAYVVLDAIAQLPKLSVYLVREVVRDTPKRFGAWAAEAANYVLSTRKPALAAPLYEVAAHNPGVAKKALVAGLKESSKGIRETCVAALSKGDESLVDDLLPLLKSKKKDARTSAAKVLEAIASPKAHKALEAALKKEKSEDASVAIEDAIRACGSKADTKAMPSKTSPDKTSPKSSKPGTDAKASGTDAAAWNTELTGGKKARLPKWVDAAALPALKLRSGDALDEAAVGAMIGRLKKEHERMDPLVWSLRPDLDPEAAATFGAALFQQWQTAGKGKSSDKWALYAQAIFADDAWIHSVAPRLDGLSSAGKHAYAGWVLEVFARHGSQAGRDWVGHWADHAMTGGLQKKAIAAVGELAAAAGVDEKTFRGSLDPFVAADQAERRVPTLDFDARGERKVSYGKRDITIRMGADGGLSAVDETGKATKSMPKPKKDDDSAAVTQAKALFKQLQGSVKRTLGSVIRRFEAGMVAGRTWSRSRFDAVFVAHPLMGTVATGLVFATAEGESFRVSEERTQIDADGEDFTLGADAVVRIVHPLELSEQDLPKWRTHLEDAEIAQPFEQIHRPTFPHTGEIDVPKTAMKPGTFLGRVRDAGWNRGYAEDAGMVYTDWIKMPARGVKVELHHSGYYAGGDNSWLEDVKIDSVGFSTLTGQYLDAKKVDPIAFSEVQLAVQRLFGKSQPTPTTPEAKATAVKTDSSGNKQRALTQMGNGFPGADNAPTSRAKCMHCDKKIEKADVRIIIERMIETPRFTGKGPGYMHAACAVEWVEAAGLDLDDFIVQLQQNTGLKKSELPSPFDA